MPVFVRRGRLPSVYAGCAPRFQNCQTVTAAVIPVNLAGKDPFLRKSGDSLPLIKPDFKQAEAVRFQPIRGNAEQGAVKQQTVSAPVQRHARLLPDLRRQ